MTKPAAFALGDFLMPFSPWISTWNRTSMKIRPLRTTQPRFVYPTVPTRTTEPCTVSTHLHPEWSFGQIHDQTSELTVPDLVLPNHLDKLKPTAEPDLTWVVRIPKTITTSLTTSLDHPADCLDHPAFVQLLTAMEPTWSDESRHQSKGHFDQI